MYKLTQTPNKVIRLADGLWISSAQDEDWKAFQQWLADGGVPLPADPLPVIIREIDARRLRLALLQLGYLSAVAAAITSLGEKAIIDWEYATTIKEDYPIVTALASNLDLDIDLIFDLANSLP